jgi:hypothetical protein
MESKLNLSFRRRRACAVHGGTYILGAQSKITDLQLNPTESGDSDSHAVSFRIPAHPTPITTDLLISGSQLEHPSTAKDPSDGTSRTQSKQANCVAVLKGIPSSLKAAFATSSGGDDEKDANDDVDATEMTQDVLLLVFPPGFAEGKSTPAVRALLMGPGTGSCPSGQCESFANQAGSPSDHLNLYSHTIHSSEYRGHREPQGRASSLRDAPTRGRTSGIHLLLHIGRDRDALSPATRFAGSVIGLRQSANGARRTRDVRGPGFRITKGQRYHSARSVSASTAVARQVDTEGGGSC